MPKKISTIWETVKNHSHHWDLDTSGVWSGFSIVACHEAGDTAALDSPELKHPRWLGPIIWRFPKMGYPQIIRFVGFSLVNHPAIWGTPMSGNPHIAAHINHKPHWLDQLGMVYCWLQTDGPSPPSNDEDTRGRSKHGRDRGTRFFVGRCGAEPNPKGWWMGIWRC